MYIFFRKKSLKHHKSGYLSETSRIIRISKHESTPPPPIKKSFFSFISKSNVDHIFCQHTLSNTSVAGKILRYFLFCCCVFEKIDTLKFHRMDFDCICNVI